MASLYDYGVVSDAIQATAALENTLADCFVSTFLARTHLGWSETGRKYPRKETSSSTPYIAPPRFCQFYNYNNNIDSTYNYSNDNDDDDDDDDNDDDELLMLLVIIMMFCATMMMVLTMAIAVRLLANTIATYEKYSSYNQNSMRNITLMT